ncbi:MAG: Mrp/NBP35 family ATP-binding protein [Candidatus Adiutrix sp.]|jgi:Mrp family chromosome partitioning ATPase|nr:Mrp/NBP35 family ATP-binding protein [Candidatus Adiutrix sp.]
MSLVTIGDLEQSRRRRDLAETLGGIGRKYLVMSGKGGVGKTTVAVNLAAAKAAEGYAVGLLDVDLHGPSVALALGLEDADMALGADEKLVPMVSEFGLKVVTIQGLLKNRDEAVIWRGPKKIRAIRQFFSEAAWGKLDYLFIDSPPGTGDEPLTVLQTVPDARPLMVTSGSRLAAGDVAKAFNFLKLLERPAAGLVDNQSWYICPKCGLETDLHDRQAAGRLAERAGVPLLASLPLDLAAGRATEEGRPLVWSQPEHLFSKRIKELAAVL